ncbi:spore germination protein [Bacillus cereus]|uniref:Spore germination protein KA n=1 Tax=Bacillus cereus VD184 TaxID=1053242 RepID=A0A9W5R596_BACCE|nr:spore germination protein [Bacillus cereus]EOQ08968.1 hypothetical protein IKC_06391 [Bacillus cereus VD184]
MDKNNVIHKQISRNIDFLKNFFVQTPDFVIRYLKVANQEQQAALVYLETLTNMDNLYHYLLIPLIYEGIEMDMLYSDCPVGFFQKAKGWNEIQDAILEGKSIVFLENVQFALIFSTQGGPKRAIEESKIETSLKSGHEGFVESKNENIALIRRYIKETNFTIKEICIGTNQQTKVSILYLKGSACEKILQELESRIKKIQGTYILNAGELGELIEDQLYSPFPQFLSTERPDTVALYLYQGRFAILTDQSPSILIAPVCFTDFFKTIDDYSTRLLIANFMRILRYFAFLLAILLPASYISVVSFNYEIIPMQLLLTIGKYRADVPFSPFIEAIIMELSIEMLRESAVRLPSIIGHTIGVVGAIIIGQAAVQAGIVSNMMIIVVASTAIASFIIPNYDMGATIRLIRFPMMILASLFGIIGIVIGIMTIIGHLISLQSLGTPYSQSLFPIQLENRKDFIFRSSLRHLRYLSKKENRNTKQEKKNE